VRGCVFVIRRGAAKTLALASAALKGKATARVVASACAPATGGSSTAVALVWTAAAGATASAKSGAFRVSVASDDASSAERPTLLQWRGDWALRAPAAAAAAAASPVAASFADGCVAVLWSDSTWCSYPLPAGWAAAEYTSPSAESELAPSTEVGSAASGLAGSGAAGAAASPAKGKRRAKEMMEATGGLAAMAGTASCAAVGSKYVAVAVLRAQGGCAVAVLDGTYGVVHARFVADVAPGAAAARLVALPSGQLHRARVALVTAASVQVAELPLEPLSLAKVVGR
jgi:hypothetical protein